MQLFTAARKKIHLDAKERHEARPVAAAEAVVDTLRKAQRQLLAATYDPAASRHAKSVQVSLTRKGVMKTSVYLEWPQVAQQVDDERTTILIPICRCRATLPLAPPVALRPAEPEGAVCDEGKSPSYGTKAKRCAAAAGAAKGTVNC